MNLRRPVRFAAALACAVAGIAAAPPAQAATTPHDGPILFTQVTNCDSVVWGTPYTEAGVGLGASALYDDAAPPTVGDVFYVSIQVGAVGNPYPCLDQSFRPDLVLPSGVELAVDGTNPIRCFKWQYGGGDATSTPEQTLCPDKPHAAESGGSVSFGTSSGANWKIPTGTGYEIQVPVRATTAGPRIFGFAVQVVDGNANPIMRPQTDVVPVGAGSSTGSTTVGTDVADVVKLGRTGGKVPAWVAVSPMDAWVKVSVLAKHNGSWVRIGSTRYQDPDATVDTRKVKVPVTPKWQRALQGKRVDARLVAVATDPFSGETDRSKEPFVLKG